MATFNWFDLCEALRGVSVDGTLVDGMAGGTHSIYVTRADGACLMVAPQDGPWIVTGGDVPTVETASFTVLTWRDGPDSMIDGEEPDDSVDVAPSIGALREALS